MNELKPVRDLEWAIGSAPLEAKSSFNSASPSAGFFYACLEDYYSHLQALYQAPAPLLEFLSSRRDKRLGAYFEDLLAYWLLTGNRFRLLERGLQVEREGKTLGELDFIVHDLKRDRIVHWEVALKFYLGYGLATKPLCWVGPNLQDNLKNKITRVYKHQLPLLNKPHTRKILESKGLRVDESQVILKGRLFYPAWPDRFIKEKAHQKQPNYWFNETQFQEEFGSQQLRWLVLDKRAWLAERQAKDFEHGLSAIELLSVLNINQSAMPMCCAGGGECGEKLRIFIVSEKWLLEAEAFASN